MGESPSTRPEGLHSGCEGRVHPGLDLGADRMAGRHTCLLLGRRGTPGKGGKCPGDSVTVRMR